MKTSTCFTSSIMACLKEHHLYNTKQRSGSVGMFHISTPFVSDVLHIFMAVYFLFVFALVCTSVLGDGQIGLNLNTTCFMWGAAPTPVPSHHPTPGQVPLNLEELLIQSILIISALYQFLKEILVHMICGWRLYFVYFHSSICVKDLATEYLVVK